MRRLPEKFEDILTIPYRSPKKGDRLLRATTDWDRGVEFAADPEFRHVQIWNGYMTAGEALIDDLRDNNHDRHALIYPILFTYRHGVELAMKWIIAMYGDRTPAEIAHHDLWQLWKLCRAVIDSAGQDDGSIDIVEKIVKDFHDLDGSALAFRYGIDKNLRPPRLPTGLFDVENIRNVMKGVAHFFDGCDGMLSDLANAGP